MNGTDGYDSHLPVLEFLFSNFHIEHAMEFGMGYYSTPFLIKHAKTLYSIETDAVWMDRIPRGKFHVAILYNKEFRESWFNDRTQHWFDLEFIDGSPKLRTLFIQNAIDKCECRFIVIHDTEPEAAKVYGWDNIALRKGYMRLDYKAHPRWTSILTRDSGAAEKIYEWLEKVNDKA